MKKKLTAVLLALFCSLTMLMPHVAYADSQKVVTLGADLDEAQRNAILRYFGVANQNNIRIIYITNQDERNHLGSFIPLEQIGTRTVSCAMVNPTMSGGIQVKTANMNYVTSNMIATTLSTSGVVNCEVLAAAPFEVSGTGALTGILMAYETAVGTNLSSEKKEIATEELVTTTKVANNIGQVDATEIINAAKMQVIQGNVIDHQEVQNIVNNVVNEMGVQLSEADYQMIIDLLTKIADQEYDYNEVKTTLERVEANMEQLAAQQAANEKALAEAAAKQAQQEAELAAAAAKQKEQELALAQAAEQQAALEAELAAAKEREKAAQEAAAAQQAAAEAAAAEAAAAKEAADAAAAEAAATAAAEAEAAPALDDPADSILTATDDEALEGAITDSTFEDDVIITDAPEPEDQPEPAPADEGGSTVDLGVVDIMNGVYEDPTTQEQPAAEQPVAEQPAAEQPAAEQPVAEQPAAEQPVAEQPAAEQPAVEQPVAEQPAAEQPVAEQPAAEQPAAENPEGAQQDLGVVDIMNGGYEDTQNVEETPEPAPVEEITDTWTEGTDQDPAIVEEPAAEPETEPVAVDEPAELTQIDPSELRFQPNLNSGSVAAGTDELTIFVPYTDIVTGTGTLTVMDVSGTPFDTITADSPDHVTVTALTPEEAAGFGEGTKIVVTLNYGLNANTSYYVLLTDGFFASADGTKTNAALTDDTLWSFDTGMYGVSFARTEGSAFHAYQPVTMNINFGDAAFAEVVNADGLLAFGATEFTPDMPGTNVDLNGTGLATFEVLFYNAEGAQVDDVHCQINILP